MIKMLLFEHDRGITESTKWIAISAKISRGSGWSWSIPQPAHVIRIPRPDWSFSSAMELCGHPPSDRQGHTEAEEAPLDGSTVAANASRHHLLNLEKLIGGSSNWNGPIPLWLRPGPGSGERPSPQKRRKFQVIPPRLLSFARRLPKPHRRPWTDSLPLATRSDGHHATRIRPEAALLAAGQRLRQQHEENQRRAKTSARPPTKSGSVPPTSRPAWKG